MHNAEVVMETAMEAVAMEMADMATAEDSEAEDMEVDITHILTGQLIRTTAMVPVITDGIRDTPETGAMGTEATDTADATKFFRHQTLRKFKTFGGLFYLRKRKKSVNLWLF